MIKRREELSNVKYGDTSITLLNLSSANNISEIKSSING